MEKRLLKIIVCPVCHKKLFLNKKKDGLICTIDNIIFPIFQGIPVFIKSKSRNLFYISK